jgi:hypothetical protein
MGDLASPSIASETVYLELTFRRLMCIWWAYFWRHMLYGAPLIVIVGFLEGLVGLGGKHLVLSLSAVVVMAVVSMVVLGVVLHKQFRHFSIRIVASPRQSTTA